MQMLSGSGVERSHAILNRPTSTQALSNGYITALSFQSDARSGSSMSNASSKCPSRQPQAL